MVFLSIHGTIVSEIALFQMCEQVIGKLSNHNK